MKTVLVLNGPNLNLPGTCEPAGFGVQGCALAIAGLAELAQPG